MSRLPRRFVRPECSPREVRVRRTRAAASDAGLWRSRTWSAGLIGLLSAAFAGAAEPEHSIIAGNAPAAFQKYCIECHGKTKPEADLSIVDLLAQPSIGLFPDEWEAIAEMMETAEMPPKDATEFPTDAERAEA